MINTKRKAGRDNDKPYPEFDNVKNYKYGLTTATSISDPARAATYLSKYLTKSIQVPKGRKRYWASRQLVSPSEEYLQMTTEEFGHLYNDSRFQKVINSPWGCFLMCET